MIYRLYRTGAVTDIDAALTVNTIPSKSFLFDVNNSDFIEFKKNLQNNAILQNTNGEEMPSSSVSDILLQFEAGSLTIADAD